MKFIAPLLSVICTIHCLLTPLLLVALPAFEHLELAILPMILVFSGFTFKEVKNHKEKEKLLQYLIGSLLSLLIGVFFHTHIFTWAGSALMLYLNWELHRKKGCQHPHLV